MSITDDKIYSSYEGKQYLAHFLAIVLGVVMLSAGVLTGLITWSVLFFAIDIYFSFSIKRRLYPYVEQHYSESIVHWVKDEQMGVLPIIYSIGVIIFVIFWYGILLLGSGYNTNSMAEASMLIIALFLLMFPILFGFLGAQGMARRHEDERSWKKARHWGAIYGVLAVIIIGYILYKIAQADKGSE